MKPFLWIFFCAILVRLFCFTGMTGYDDFAYADIAQRLLRGMFDPLSHPASGPAAVRPMMFLPTALSLKLFGASELATSLFPLLCSLGNVLLAYLIGKRLWGERAGIFAASLLSVFPLSVVYATILYPEEIQAFFLSLSVLLFLEGKERKHPALWGAVAGLALGLGYLSRITALLFIPVLLALWILERRPRIGYWILAGFLGVVLIEGIFYAVRFGEPLARLTHTFSKLSQDVSTPFDRSPWTYPKAMFGGNLYGLSIFGFFFPAFLISLVYLFHKGRLRELLLPLLWAALIFLGLEFSFSGPGLRLTPRQLRYLSQITMPVSLLLGFTFSLIYESRRWTAGILSLFLFSTSLVGAKKMSEYHRGYILPYLRAGQFLSVAGAEKILVSSLSLELRLRFYLPGSYKGNPRFERFSGTPLSLLPGSFVVFDENNLLRLPGAQVWNSGGIRIYHAR